MALAFLATGADDLRVAGELFVGVTFLVNVLFASVLFATTFVAATFFAAAFLVETLAVDGIDDSLDGVNQRADPSSPGRD
ncbi:MAG: hypothetical protein PXZ08_04400 [Actinomycetota bacterium]|nr:hypothetical protein [Actinomycetota bacterium]